MPKFITDVRVLLFILLIVLISAVFGCGPSKPNGSEYLGKWDGATALGGAGIPFECPLDITKNGESFLVSVEGHGGSQSYEEAQHVVCGEYEGIYTLTPEGNLKGGPMGMRVMSFDREKNQVVLSGGGGLQYLRRH